MATSLNAALPVALHEATLEIYDILFQQGIIGGTHLLIQDRNFMSPVSVSSLSSEQPT